MDDKKRPYKMYASMVSAALTAGLADWVGAPLWASLPATMVIAGLAVYWTPNPKV